MMTWLPRTRCPETRKYAAIGRSHSTVSQRCQRSLGKPLGSARAAGRLVVLVALIGPS
jgi:hypothetical protein